MTPQEKPEWIKIAELDNAGAIRKSSKGLPVIALLAVAAIIGVGAVVAQTPGESPALAVESASPSLQSSQPLATSQSTPSASITTVHSRAKEPPASTVSPTPSNVANPAIANPAIANPAIATMPTGGGDDDHEGNEEENGHKNHGEHDDEGDDEEDDD